MKPRSLLLFVTAILIAGPMSSPAPQFGDFTYESSGREISITGYVGPGGNVTIPDTINNLPVTSIGDAAFVGCTSLTSITVPDSVTNIGYAVFAWCTSLTSVTIPNGVTSIGNSGFLDCTSLTSVVIPNSTRSIGAFAFCGCTSLTNIMIGTGVNNIEIGAFSYCSNLEAIDVDGLNPAYRSQQGVLFDKVLTTLVQYPGGNAGSYTIPNSVTNIGGSAFSGCMKLDSVTIPHCVLLFSPGSTFYKRPILGAFARSGLTNITIPDSVTSIGEAAFWDCTSLTNVAIGNGVTNVGLAAFKGCSNLPRIVIPDSVLTIEGSRDDGFWSLGAFSDCISLNSVIIGSGVKTIGELVFYNCTALPNVTIPDCVTDLEVWTFFGCSRLTGVYFEGNAPNADSDRTPLDHCPAAIVYYRAGTAGWGPTFCGHPTALWVEPPVYADWVQSTALPTQYPNASAEDDDPDQDGMSNYAEMLAGTSPTDSTSSLVLKVVPRPNDLSDADKTPIAANQHAMYFRSVPGKSYGVQWTDSLDGPWNTVAVVTPTTTQKRIVFAKPETQAFYRVLVAQ